jgi:hypothetical protein
MKYILIVCVLVAALGVTGMTPDCANGLAASAPAARVPCHASFIPQVDSQAAHPLHAAMIVAASLILFSLPFAPLSAAPGQAVLAARTLAAKPLTPPPRSA